MDKLIDKAIKEMQDMNTLNSNFTISSQGRDDIYTAIANILISNNMHMDTAPTVIMSYLKGYERGSMSLHPVTELSKETAKRNSHIF